MLGSGSRGGSIWRNGQFLSTQGVSRLASICARDGCPQGGDRPEWAGSVHDSPATERNARRGASGGGGKSGASLDRQRFRIARNMMLGS